MIFDMGSPFQPDTAAEWWNFGVNVAIALATLAAVVVALREAARARQLTQASEDRRVLAEQQAALESRSRHARSIHIEANPQGGVDPSTRRIRVMLLISNRGTTPIFDVRPSWMNDALVAGVYPARDPDELVPPAPSGTTPPLFARLEGDSRSTAIIEIQLTEDAPATLPVLLPFALTFTDITGQYWAITPNNYVRLLADSPIEDGRGISPGFYIG